MRYQQSQFFLLALGVLFHAGGIALGDQPADEAAHVIEISIDEEGKGSFVLGDRQDKDRVAGDLIEQPVPGLSGAAVYQMPDSCLRIVYDFAKVTGQIPWIDEHVAIGKGLLIFKPVNHDGRFVSTCWPGRSVRLPIRIRVAAKMIPKNNLQVRLEPVGRRDGFLSLSTKDGIASLIWFPTGQQQRVLARGQEPENSFKEWAFQAPMGEETRWSLHIVQAYEFQQSNLLDAELLKLSSIEITGRLAGMLGLGVEAKGNKVVANKVLAGFPGEKAGIKVGDIISSVNGTPATTPSAFLVAISELDIGDPVRLSIVRDGKKQKITVVAE